MSENLRDRGFSLETQLVAGEKLDQLKKLASNFLGEKESWCVPVDIDGKLHTYYVIGRYEAIPADALFEGGPLDEGIAFG